MSYFIQKAIDIEDLKAKGKAKFTQMLEKKKPSAIQPKYDGCHGLLTFDLNDIGKGPISCRTSSGDPWVSINPLYFEPIIDSLVKDWNSFSQRYVTIAGESWTKGWKHSEINGVFRRQSVQETLGYVLFDCVNHPCIDVLEDNRPWLDRFETIRGIQKGPLFASEVINLHFNDLTDLTSEAKKWKNKADVYDGIIFRDPFAGYKAGRCRDSEVVKIKPAIELDLRVLSFKPAFGEKTGKQTGALVVEFKGKPMGVAVLEESLLEELHANPEAWSGKIAAIEAMAESSKGLLREPVLKGLRLDKTEPDA